MYPEICVGVGGLPHEHSALLLFAVFFVHCLFPMNLTLLSLSQAWLGDLWNGFTIILFSPGSCSTLQRKTRSGSSFCWLSNPRSQVSRFSGQGLFSASQSRQKRAHLLLVLTSRPDVVNSEWMEVPAEHFWNRGLLSPVLASLALVLTDRDFY